MKSARESRDSQCPKFGQRRSPEGEYKKAETFPDEQASRQRRVLSLQHSPIHQVHPATVIQNVQLGHCPRPRHRRLGHPRPQD